jgi:dTDP-4-amino-4,6-dideoxygalactose transaminase
MSERGTYRIRFQAPEIPSSTRIEQYFQLSRDCRWFANRGPCQELLESRLAADLGPDAHVVPVSNATAGLMVAIRTLAGVPGDKRHVIVPSYTFIATVSAILWAGFEPIFVDVDPAGWHMSPESAEAAIDRHGDTIALVMACSTFGVPQPLATLGLLREITAKADVPLLVDAAAGFGSARTDGARPWCDGDLDVYSFHATKPFAIGEGGLVVAPDRERADRVASLCNFGFDVNRDVGADVGINAKMDEWHCATALAVLDEFPAVLKARTSRSQYVKAALASHGYSAQAGSDLASNQFVAVLAPTERVRDECVRTAADRGIEIRTYYHHPLHRSPALAGYPRAGALTVTDSLAPRALSLPLANDTSYADLDAVIKACTDAATVAHD